MVAEAQGALTCRSTTLAILADSGPFHGLILIDLVFPERFLWLLNPNVRLRGGH